MNEEKRELKKWEDFKNVGIEELEMKIRLLKKELSDMNENFIIVSGEIKAIFLLLF